MLKQRVLTALLLLPLVMAAIFAAPAQWFLILLAIILLGGSWEYRRLAGVASHPAGYLMVAAQAIILAVLFWYQRDWATGIHWYLSICCAAWLLMFIRLPLYRPGSLADSTYRAISVSTAIASVTSCWFALSWLRIQPQGSWLILLLLLIVWAADTGAYFSGKAFGKRKLAPHISPGKTLAGLTGGLIAATLIALLAVYLMPIAPIEPVRLVLLSLVTALVSVGGDLMISLHKRTSGFKDSGNILPGHGGILDRVDSLLAAAPFFALGMLMSGY
ncbi:MAG TPA: phosphatidate cytidylyltransferase [Xanthomonadales bacterium]